MSSRIGACCVSQCNNKTAVRLRILRNKEIRDIWLNRINNTKLLKMSEKQVQNYAVCDIHFPEFCKEGTKLKKFSLPALHLPGNKCNFVFCKYLIFNMCI